MIPEFARFYSYTVAQIMDEHAITFFTLVNTMYRLKAKETLTQVAAINAGTSGDSSNPLLDDLKKQERGIHGIVEEVRNIK